MEPLIQQSNQVFTVAVEDSAFIGVGPDTLMSAEFCTAEDLELKENCYANGLRYWRESIDI